MGYLRGRSARKNNLVHLSMWGPCAKLREYFQLSYLVRFINYQLRILVPIQTFPIFKPKFWFLETHLYLDFQLMTLSRPRQLSKPTEWLAQQSYWGKVWPEDFPKLCASGEAFCRKGNKWHSKQPIHKCTIKALLTLHPSP